MDTIYKLKIKSYMTGKMTGDQQKKTTNNAIYST